jgi:hypothetical protein
VSSEDLYIVLVSGFRKEELKVLYNTSRKLKVTGERPVAGGARARWARFLKSFPVPRSVDTGGIKAVMDKDKAVLYVILPKGSPSSSTDRQKDKERQQKQPGSSLPLPHGEQKAGTGNADGASGSSTGGSFLSAQEDAEKNRTKENNVVPEEIKVTIHEEEVATQDGPRTNARADANAVEKDDEDDDEEDGNKRWWQKIRPLHVLGFVVLILALVGIGALCVLL